MNKNQLEGAWGELKGKVKKQWGKLTDDELTKINGRYEELCGSLQRNYGYSKEVAQEHVDKFFDIKE